MKDNRDNEFALLKKLKIGIVVYSLFLIFLTLAIFIDLKNAHKNMFTILILYIAFLILLGSNLYLYIHKRKQFANINNILW